MTLKGLKKLILHPKTFIKDYINKKYKLNDTKINIPVNQKPKPKPKPKPKSKPKNISSNIETVNLFTSFTHILYTGENRYAINHLDLWIPYFIEADIEFIVITRYADAFNDMIEKYPLLNIVFLKSEKDVQDLIKKMTFLRACFYPSNTGPNLHLLKQTHLKHIFIGHGDSDKSASAHKYFRVYDENWVAGEAHIDRFKNEGFDFSGLKFVKVGRPNLLKILQSSTKVWNERFGSQINLLYLSTWEGVYTEQNYTSVYIIDEIIDILKDIENLSLKVKLHPRVGSRDEMLLDTNEHLKELTEELELDCTVYNAEKPVDELIIKSNVFICDISAVVSECLAANGPIFVYIPKDKEIKLSQSNMKFEDYTYTFSTIDELAEKFNEVILEKNDYLKESREKAMEYILGKEAILNQRFIKELKFINSEEV